MPSKHRRRDRAERKRRRTEALAANATARPAAATTATAVPPMEPGPEERAGAAGGDARSDGWRWRTLVPLMVAGVLIAGLAALAVLATRQPTATPAGSVAPTIVAGTPGGQVISGSASSPSPAATATAAATPSATVAPTEAPTPAPTPTPAPVATATPEPQTPAPTPTTAPPPVTPGPTPVVVAVAEPDDAVAAFYGHVVAGNFDAAYAFWSDRMKATYPRQENLDDRFAETVEITFQDLFVVERGAGTATVQANFTETYASGTGRQFIGYWRLVLVDGRWLLDEPNY